MALVKKWFFWFVVGVVSIAALLAATENSQNVALSFLGWETAEWPVSWWVLIAFVLGVLFGMLLNFYTNTKLRLDARRANRAAQKTSAELDKARAEPTPEPAAGAAEATKE